eukprot:g250.t1
MSSHNQPKYAAQQTNVYIGDSDLQTEYHRTNELGDPWEKGFRPSAFAATAKAELRKVNFDFGYLPRHDGDNYKTTSQLASESYNPYKARRRDAVNPSKECNVYFGSQDGNQPSGWASTYTLASKEKDLKGAIENRKAGMSNGKDNYTPHWEFGRLRGTKHWKITGRLPAPEDGVEYTQKAADGKALVARTNWDLGEHKTEYETGAMELNRYAKEPVPMIEMELPKFKMGKPQKVKKEMNKKLKCNVTLGVDTFEYMTDSQRNFIVRKQDRDFAKERETNRLRKKELQKTNFELGSVKTDYFKSSQLWDPHNPGTGGNRGGGKGYPKPSEIRSEAFDPTLLRKTNYVLGLEKTDWKTDSMHQFGDEAHLSRMAKAVRNRRTMNGPDPHKVNVVIGDWQGKTETCARGDFTAPPASAYSLDRTRQKEMKAALTRTNLQLSAPGSKVYFETTNREELESHTAQKYKPAPSAKKERKELKAALSRSNFKLGPHATEYKTDSQSAHKRFDSVHYNPPDKEEQKRRKKLLASSNFVYGFHQNQTYETSHPHQSPTMRRR